MAPIRMWFRSEFVLLTLLGRQIKWTAQRRNDSETGWREALEHHRFSTLLAFGWLIGAYYLSPILAWWLFPVLLPLIFSLPLSVFSSRIAIGPVAGAFPDPGRKPFTAGRRKRTNFLK
jgi:membrane glycosyltransferase